MHLNIKIIYNFLFYNNPVKLYKIAKKEENEEEKEKAKKAIKTTLTNMGYGGRNISTFSLKEQKLIMELLQCIEEGLLDFLEQIKKPD